MRRVGGVVAADADDRADAVALARLKNVLDLVIVRAQAGRSQAGRWCATEPVQPVVRQVAEVDEGFGQDALNPTPGAEYPTKPGALAGSPDGPYEAGVQDGGWPS